MEKEELTKLKEKIRQKYIADIEAIDRVLSIMGNCGRKMTSTQATLPGVAVGEDAPKNPTQILREIIRTSDDNFSVSSLIGEYEKRKPSAMGAVRPRYVALLLNRSKGTLVEQVQSGRGKKSLWRRIP